MSELNVSTFRGNSLSSNIKKNDNNTGKRVQNDNKEFNLILNKISSKKQHQINNENKYSKYDKNNTGCSEEEATELELKEKLQKYFESLKEEKTSTNNKLDEESLNGDLKDIDNSKDLLDYLCSIINMISTPKLDGDIKNINLGGVSKLELNEFLKDNLKSNSEELFLNLKNLILKEFNKEDNQFSTKEMNISEEFDNKLKMISDILEGIYNKNTLESSNQSEKKDLLSLFNKKLDINTYNENLNRDTQKQGVNDKKFNTESFMVNEKPIESNDSAILNTNKTLNKDEGLLKSLTEDKENDKFSNRVNLNLMKFEGLKNDSVKFADTNIPVVRKEVLQQDIIKWVKFINTEDVKELTLKVVPRELGEIVLKVSVDSGVMKAEILANNKDTYKLLQNNMADITSKLENDSIKVQEVSVNIYSDNYMGEGNENLKDNGNGQFSNKNKQNKKRDFEHIDKIEENKVASLDEMLNMLA